MIGDDGTTCCPLSAVLSRLVHPPAQVARHTQQRGRCWAAAAAQRAHVAPVARISSWRSVYNRETPLLLLLLSSSSAAPPVRPRPGSIIIHRSCSMQQQQQQHCSATPSDQRTRRRRLPAMLAGPSHGADVHLACARVLLLSPRGAAALLPQCRWSSTVAGASSSVVSGHAEKTAVRRSHPCTPHPHVCRSIVLRSPSLSGSYGCVGAGPRFRSSLDLPAPPRASASPPCAPSAASPSLACKWEKDGVGVSLHY